MHFLLLGATGRTGQHIVTTLLSRNHTITALVRDPTRLPTHSNLTATTGSPLNQSDITAAINAHPTLRPNAAIITLNTVRESDSPFAKQVCPPRFLADSVAACCAALEGTGVGRVVVMSTVGVGESWAELPWASRAFMRWTNVKYALEDHGIVDREMRGRSGVEWTLVRAVRLRFEDGDGRDGKVEVLGCEGKGMKMSDSIGTGNVARFLVRVAVDGLYLKEAVVVRDR